MPQLSPTSGFLVFFCVSFSLLSLVIFMNFLKSPVTRTICLNAPKSFYF